MSTGSVVLVAHWIARVWSILSILTVLFFAVNELLPSVGPAPTLQEWLGLALSPSALVWDWSWHGMELGGILALGCLVAFYVWNLFHSGHLPRGPFFFLIAAPGLFFLFAGFLSHRGAVRES